MRTRFFGGLVLEILLLTMIFPAGDIRAWAQSKDTKQKDQQQAPQPSQTPGGFAITVTVPVVPVDVVVTDNNGNFLTGLKKDNFRLTEDGAVQTITNFAPSDAPITIVLSFA